MDIFPRATDDGSMDDRREILVKAAKIAGVAFAAPLVSAATPYVRLRDETGMLSDETNRIRRELELIAEREPVDPAAQTATAIYATWANIDALRNASNTEIEELKARAAIYAGISSITRMDKPNGARWFDLAQRYSRMSGNDELISLAHYHEAVAGMWWEDRSNLGANMYLTGTYAATPEQRGLAHNIRAKLAAERYDRQQAVTSMEKAVSCARDSNGVTRSDGWITPQAHAFAAKTLSRFGELLPAVEAHTAEALRTLPPESVRLRTHTQFALASARVSAREFDAAAHTILSAIDRANGGQLQPVHVKRIREILDQAEMVNAPTEPFRPVRQQLAAMFA